jgi:ribosomal protein S25
MLFALLITPGITALCGKSQHEALSEAHRKTEVLAQRLYDEVDHLNAIERSAIRPHVEAVAAALQQVREAEQACTRAGAPRGKVAAWNYQQMLDRQQAAFTSLEQMQKEMSTEVPRLNHVISYAIDIRRQMDMAEESHRDSMAK